MTVLQGLPHRGTSRQTASDLSQGGITNTFSRIRMLCPVVGNFISFSVVVCLRALVYSFWLRFKIERRGLRLFQSVRIEVSRILRRLEPFRSSSSRGCPGPISQRKFTATVVLSALLEISWSTERDFCCTFSHFRIINPTPKVEVRTCLWPLLPPPTPKCLAPRQRFSEVQTEQYLRNTP
jgi:hypothetical protein